ncbi:MAG: TonB-dependent receptor [Chlorobi bacterium]|nr:TonB-dependent receptor [Chlorobiota bacterium]
MKKFKIFVVLILFGINSYAQKISGTVENENGEKVPEVIVTISKINKTTATNQKGYFEFDNLKKGNYTLSFSFIGYETTEKTISLTNNNAELTILLKHSDIIADEVIVTAIRADENTPVAYTNIEKSEIDKQNNGQDIPYLLDLTPSVVVTSDAGAGVGYTSMRIRGTDMTRINVTLDGIPLNDPESHGVWWVDLPDFASSVDNIQIQRGVGTSVNGAAAFGANINFVSNEINKNTYVDLNQTFGSFNTYKSTVKAGTGLLNNHFIFDFRLSKIHSDGYIDRAKSDLKSYYLSGTYVDKKNFFKVKLFSGTENTYQAWYGVPKDSLLTNRTYNPYTYDNEVDNYTQKHIQFFYTHEFNNRLSLNFALHRTDGEGYYEQYKENQDFADYNIDNLVIGNDTLTSTDLIRRKWLDNTFVGAVYSLKYRNKNINIVFGGSANQYDGDHFGRIIWARYASNSDIRHEWYRNTGIKKELSNYLKINYNLKSHLNLWADLQLRNINYDISGTHDDLRDISQTHLYNFFNPKAGISYRISDNQNSYVSFALANREPSRSNFTDAAPNETILPERLYDYEAGYKVQSENIAFNVNLYFMDYNNQLILTGEINNVGAYVMSNVPNSYRAGVELSGGIKITDFLKWQGNATFSKNKIKNLTVYVDNWDTWGQETESYPETDISFSPAIIAGSEFTFNIFKGLNAGFTSKYVGRQYIDNTESKDRSLNPYFVNNLRISYTLKTKYIKEIGFNLFVNNIFNEQYESNAWVYRYIYEGKSYDMFGYFPQAGINFIAGISLKFQ